MEVEEILAIGPCGEPHGTVAIMATKNSPRGLMSAREGDKYVFIIK
jgi:hypothetical protein